MMSDEQQALQAFNASQQRRDRIAVVVTLVVALLFGALYAYRAYLRSEANRPIEIRLTP